jgi:hypothetical protein
VTLEKRATAIRLLIKELSASNVELVLAADTVAAATHAAEYGLIQADALAEISAKKHEDEKAPTLVEQLPVVGEVAAKNSANQDG